MLIGQFLGTGAAEGIPTPFCHCPICEHARKIGGHAENMAAVENMQFSVKTVVTYDGMKIL